MKIYTKTGDSGSTGLFGGPRVFKDDIRICAYGSIDELNAVLGICRCSPMADRLDGMLQQIQNVLFAIGAELASPNPEAHQLKWQGLPHVAYLEQWIDALNEELPELRNFILPGGCKSAAHLHLARTVCRRAERDVVRLSHDASVSEMSQIVTYLNRLSDLLFVMARWSNQFVKVADVAWQKPASGT